MTISQEYTDLLMQVSRAVARRFARQYPGIEADDIASEITAEALKDWKHIHRKLKNASQYGATEYQTLYFLLSTRASQYCGKTHYQYILSHPQAVIYKPAEVRALLREMYFNPDAWEAPDKDQDQGAAVVAGGVWANLSDLRAALDRIPDRTYQVILAAFGPEDLNLPQPDKRRVSEAVAALTRELNRHLNASAKAHDEGPGTRRVMSNATAQMMTE